VDSVLVAVVLMWASTFVLFKVAWRNVDPVAFTAVRFAAIVLLAGAVLALSRNRVPLRRADVPLIVASGLCGYFLYQLFFVLGLDRTSAVASAILVATHPLFSVLFLWMLWRERPTRIQLVGVGLGWPDRGARGLEGRQAVAESSRSGQRVEEAGGARRA